MLRSGAIVANTAIVQIGGGTDTRNVTTLSVQFVTTDGDGVPAGGAAGGIEGTWKVEVSNSIAFDPDNIYGAIWNAGVWTDITSQLSPPVPAADGSGQGSSYLDLLILVDWPYRHIRITFTPTNGTDFVASDGQYAYAYLVGKSDGN